VLASSPMQLAIGAWLAGLAAAVAPLQGAAERLRVEERPGSILQVEDGRLVRLRDGRSTPLGCTDPSGPGAIRDLALDPAGNTFVAAERGLFLAGPDSDVLDRVDLGEGAPRGRPTSVRVDARRRVWISTEEASGVVDSSFFWGRTIAPSDGSAGSDPYRPDTAPSPEVRSVSLNGAPCAAGATYHVPYGAPTRLDATGTAGGGASFRWRLDHHHVWRSLEERVDPALQPGSHVLEVVAVDRDLNRSQPFRTVLAVDLPARYEPRILVPLAAGSALTLVLASVYLSVRRARGRGGPGPWLRGIVGGAVAAALLGQVAAGLVPHAKAWPFVGFSMYAETHAQGSVTYDEGLVGIDARGERRRIDEISLGSASDDRWQVLGSLLEGGEEVAAKWIERYDALHPEDPIVRVQVVAERRRLTPGGPVRIAPLVFGDFGRGGARDGR